jgi:NAD(P)-dependent dehydrogenase (short-subunit alcohol dehydrogenase family)
MDALAMIVILAGEFLAVGRHHRADRRAARQGQGDEQQGQEDGPGDGTGLAHQNLLPTEGLISRATPSWTTTTPFLHLDDNAWRDLCEINVIGSANSIRLGALRMRERGGLIIAVSSAISSAPQIGNVHYVTTKAALNMMIKGAACELGRFGIRVNGLLPGLTPTDLADVEVPPALFEQHIARTALGRVSNPDEQGNCAVFLASDASRFITGQLIAVDGGLSTQAASDLSLISDPAF